MENKKTYIANATEVNSVILYLESNDLKIFLDDGYIISKGYDLGNIRECIMVNNKCTYNIFYYDILDGNHIIFLDSKTKDNTELISKLNKLNIRIYDAVLHNKI